MGSQLKKEEKQTEQSSSGNERNEKIITRHVQSAMEGKEKCVGVNEKSRERRVRADRHHLDVGG